MGISINGGTPKWMVYNGNLLIKMDDLGVPLFQETTKYAKIPYEWASISAIFWSCSRNGLDMDGDPKQMPSTNAKHQGLDGLRWWNQ